MWLEDFILEIPMVIIAIHIATFLNAPLTVALVLFGGLLGIGVAVAETIIQCRGPKMDARPE